MRWEGGSGSCVKRMQITALGVNSSKPAVQRNANSDDYNTEQVSTRDPRSWHLTFKQNLFQRGVSEKRGFSEVAKSCALQSSLRNQEIKLNTLVIRTCTEKMGPI